MSNICKCPNPPGGEVTCDSNQIAICRVRNGVIESYCINPPSSINYRTFKDNNDFIYEILYKITEEERWRKKLPPTTTLPSLEGAIDVLLEGIYKNPETRESVSFKLPRRFGNHLIMFKRMSKRNFRTRGRRK